MAFLRSSTFSIEKTLYLSDEDYLKKINGWETEIRSLCYEKLESRSEGKRRRIVSLERQLNDIKKTYPDDPRVYILHGMLFERICKNGQALKQFQLSIKKAPTYWRAYLYAAHRLIIFGRYEESKTLLNKIMQSQHLDDPPITKQIKEARGLLTSIEYHAKQILKTNNQLTVHNQFSSLAALSTSKSIRDKAKTSTGGMFSGTYKEAVLQVSKADKKSTMTILSRSGVRK